MERKDNIMAKPLKIASWKTLQQRGATYFYYRIRIMSFAFLLALVLAYFAPLMEELPVFIASYGGFGVVLDILIYKVLRRKESQKISAATLMKWDGLTPDQLDQFTSRMVNLRLFTYIIGVMGFGLTGFNIDLLSVWLLVIFCLRAYGLLTLFVKKRYPFPLSYAATLYKALNTQQKSTLHESIKPISSYRETMDNAFYAGTGVITYRKW